jgi:hypothetical protein
LPSKGRPHLRTMASELSLEFSMDDRSARYVCSAGTLRSVLPTITDAASAPAAIPKLREATTQLNEVSDLAAKLSPEGKSALAKLIAAARPTINQMCDNVLATPGVGDVAKPTIDELRRKIETLSRS